MHASHRASWFDLVVVLQTNNTVLYGRLEQRCVQILLPAPFVEPPCSRSKPLRALTLGRSGYSARKLTENIDCEIFGVVLEEAQESYAPELVRAMQSETEDDRAINLAELQAWLGTATPSDKKPAGRPAKKSKA